MGRWWCYWGDGSYDEDFPFVTQEVADQLALLLRPWKESVELVAQDARSRDAALQAVLDDVALAKVGTSAFPKALLMYSGVEDREEEKGGASDDDDVDMEQEDGQAHGDSQSGRACEAATAPKKRRVQTD